jgi:hypothetical protein
MHLHFQHPAISEVELEEMIKRQMIFGPDGKPASPEVARQLSRKAKDGYVDVNWSYETQRGIPYATQMSVIQPEGRSSNMWLGRDVVEEWKFNSRPDHALFTLSHYGFPEPTGVSWGWPWWVKGMLSGSILICISWIFMRYFKRRSK